MRHVVCSFIIVLVVLLAFGLSSSLILAQETPLDIRLIPQIEYAVAGEPFTYTLAVTNVSQIAVDDVLVFAQTPTGTTFIRAGAAPNWAVSGLPAGETGNVLWTPRAPVPPGEAINFDLVVQVPPEMVDRQLVSSQYGFALAGSSEVSLSGRVVKIDVLAARPTPTLVPTATPTTLPTASPTATHTLQPTATATTTETPVPTATRPPEAAAKTPVSSLRTGPEWSTILAGLALAVLVVAGVIFWYFRRGRAG